MALSRCRECDSKVSTEAAVCPICGVPRPTREAVRRPPPRSRGKGVAAITGLVVLTLLVAAALSMEQGEPAPDDEREAPVVVLDVRSVAGKSPGQVAAVLGAPSETGTTRANGVEYPEIYYRSGQIDVVYVDGIADWITIREPAGVPFGPSAIAAFGLDPDPEPTFANRHTVRWENYQHPSMREIFLFPRPGGGIDFIQFRYRTDPVP